MSMSAQQEPRVALLGMDARAGKARGWLRVGWGGVVGQGVVSLLLGRKRRLSLPELGACVM